MPETIAQTKNLSSDNDWCMNRFRSQSIITNNLDSPSNTLTYQQTPLVFSHSEGMQNKNAALL